MSDADDFDALDDEIASLGTSLQQATQMAAAFSGELGKVQRSFLQTSQTSGVLAKGMDRGLRRAFDGVVFDGMRVSDAMQQVGQTLMKAAYSAAIKPVTGHFGQLFEGALGGILGDAMPFAKGGAFSQGRVQPFAKGGVVAAPTTFPMRGGTGLMGEAGPEAIMPLTRGPDGSLGVKAQGGAARPVTVVMNITTPDVQGFARSQSQISAQMTRALARGQRNQ
ncbi:phage tail tape measure protein [Nereida sp. MMG025]|uniref:phage tail tape measure protein n=1 Tax=Nereida sp. MMG025 TaxID=2909981 RepID=UPI001F3FA8DB|nr:phage tail tape measure protein [Nereida sp. MMG025]MCF6443483.1 phage tail tape measure protein [Nereida sp. MMG025]